MSHQHNNFYDKLQELKYPKLANFSPASFDWLFDNEESLEFLTWFCKFVDSRNLVTDEELERFNQLKKEGKVLEGRLLKEALENCCGPEENLSDIEESITQLESKKKHLLEQRDLYINAIQHSSLKQKQIDEAISKKKDEVELETQVEQTLKSFNQECLKMGEVLHQIQTSTTKLNDQLDKKFLFAVSLDSFNQTEETIFQSLMLYAKKHFQELDNVDTDLKHQAEQHSEGTESTPPIKENHSLREAQNLLLSDLREKLPRVIGDSIYNQVEAEVNSRLVETHQTILREITEKTFPTSSLEISHASKMLEQKIADASEDVQFLKQEVEILVEQLAELKCSSIVLEDQKIRLMRQEHFMKQQQKFIQLQSKQWAREQLLLSALRFEKSVVEGVLDSWRALSSTISESESLFVKYLSKMADYSTALDNSLDRTTIPRSDVVLLSALEVLGLGSPMPKEDGIYDYEDLVQMAKSCSQANLSEVSALRDNFSKVELRIKQCKGYLSSMEKYCLADSQVSEFSQEISTKLDNLTSACNKFSLLLKPLQKSFRSKLSQSKSKGSKVENAWISFYRQL